MQRVALRVMQFGALAVVLVAATFTSFELDRFFVPKELVLHATALIAGSILAWRVSKSRVDLLLLGYLALGVMSLLFATNRWAGLRALTITASALAIFWSARALREAGLERPLLNGLALAVIAAAVTSLLQTYGLDLIFFAENRAPGGTLGNRNFVAHVAAFGLPLVLLAALRAERRRTYLVWSIGGALVTASLVLTRSRAAWLAFAVVVGVFFVAAAPSWKRLAGITAICGIGVALALVLPNALHWRGRNPYLQSVKRVADYQGGSGRGRLVQYGQSLSMALHHPLFGVGPGNWPVEYPRYAARHDPSLSETDGGMTTNPWPSSDWVAWTAERGFPAVVLLALAFLRIAMSALRQLRVDRLQAATLLATLAGVGVTGLFDAVLLLAVPAFLVWAALGAMYVGQVILPVPTRGQAGLPVLQVSSVLILTALGVAYSGAQLVAMRLYETHSFARAAQIDPGNYRIHLRLARSGRCDDARAAHALFPNADAARELSRRCGR